jgi:DNA-binding FadR family transcriptional regulator
LDRALTYLEPLDAPSRGEAVLGALARMIERAGLRIGDKLPPEVQLAAQLGVGRSTMREALNRWEALGLIRRRRGDGTYLSAQVQFADGVPVSTQLEGAAILHILEVRRPIETEAVRKAARNATPAQRQEIMSLCEALLAVVAQGGNYREADGAFHGAVHEASGNPMFGDILRRIDLMVERSRESPFAQTAFGLASFPIHRDLAEAIAAADPDGAAAAITAIIDSVEAEIKALIRLTP